MASNHDVVAQIIAEAWDDPLFRQQLLANPAAIMRDRGIDVPPDVNVVMHENSANTRHVVLPHRPPDFSAGASVQAAILGGTVPFYLFPGRGGRGGGGGGGRKGGGRKGGGRKGGGRKGGGRKGGGRKGGGRKRAR